MQPGAQRVRPQDTVRYVEPMVGATWPGEPGLRGNCLREISTMQLMRHRSSSRYQTGVDEYVLNNTCVPFPVDAYDQSCRDMRSLPAT